MKKTTLKLAIAVALGATVFASTSAQSATLSIDGDANGDSIKLETTYVNGKGVTVTNQYTQGSWFSMDADGNGTVSQGEVTQISGLAGGGLIIDNVTSQASSGSHNGTPGCAFDGGACSVGATPDDPATTTIDESAPGFAFTEAPAIDNPWGFFGQTGMHQTTAPVKVLSNDDAGNVTLDFGGWDVTWAGIPSIPMGGTGAESIATMTCYTSGAYDLSFPFALITGAVTDCAAGTFYTIDHNASVPLGDPSGFGGVPYVVHLEGTISGALPDVMVMPAVPVPAAVWLFGSGLLGLVGVARRRQA